MAQANCVSNAIRALITGASAKPSTNSVRSAHAEFVTAVAKHPPWPIPLIADTTDLEDRADHLNTALNALSVYVAAVLDDVAFRAGLISARSRPFFPNLSYDVTGTIQRAADDMAGRVA
jgi:hypothetical protein